MFKSNSALLAFDYSIFKKPYVYDFLNYIQNISFDVAINRETNKFIGSESSIKNQFIKPDIVLKFSYFQRIDFINERMLGMNIGWSDDFLHKSSLNNYINNFNNQNAYILFSDKKINDLVYQIKETGFNNEMTYISLGNLYMSNYSLSYKVNQIPSVSVEMVANNLYIDKLKEKSYYGSVIEDSVFYQGYSDQYEWKTYDEYAIKDFDNNKILLDANAADRLLKRTNQVQSNDIIYVMDDFNLQTDFQEATSTPGPTIDSFLSGLIQSLDISIDFNRSKYYFFDKGDSPYDRKINLPARGSLKISGISNGFELGNLKTFFLKDEKFYLQITATGNHFGQIIISKIIINNITIQSFDYSLDLQNNLIYTINCIFDITTDSGIIFNNIINDVTNPNYIEVIEPLNLTSIITSDSEKIYVHI